MKQPTTKTIGGPAVLHRTPVLRDVLPPCVLDAPLSKCNVHLLIGAAFANRLLIAWNKTPSKDVLVDLLTEFAIENSCPASAPEPEAPSEPPTEREPPVTDAGAISLRIGGVIVRIEKA